MLIAWGDGLDEEVALRVERRGLARLVGGGDVGRAIGVALAGSFEQMAALGSGELSIASASALISDTSLLVGRTLFVLLLPLMMVGLMEYKFMGELTGSKAEKKLARLFEQLLSELRDQTQSHYDSLAPLFEAAPSVDRTVPTGSTSDGKSIRIIPVDKPLETTEEVILPSQTVEAIINKFDDIAVGHCFCRQRRRLLGDTCQTKAPVLNCFSFGKSARHTSAQGFAQKVTREEALNILKEAQQAGLIHKAFHPGSRETSPETSICNCCKDCCDTLRLWRDGTLPMINSTYHLSIIDTDACTGCGTCLEWCTTDAIVLDDGGIARRDESACLGCGVCARFCPESAIALKEGLRKVFILPPQLRRA